MASDFSEKIKFICNQPEVSIHGQFWASSYRFHPHGFQRDGVLIYDHHNTNGYYSILISEDPNAEWTKHMNHSTLDIDPLPRPVGCDRVLVWTMHRGWLNRGPWVEKIIKLVDKIESELVIELNKKAIANAEAKQQKDDELNKKKSRMISSWKDSDNGK